MATVGISSCHNCCDHVANNFDRKETRVIPLKDLTTVTVFVELNFSHKQVGNILQREHNVQDPSNIFPYSTLDCSMTTVSVVRISPSEGLFPVDLLLDDLKLIFEDGNGVPLNEIHGASYSAGAAYWEFSVDSSHLPAIISPEDPIEVNDTILVVSLVEPASELYEFEVHVTTSPSGQPIGDVPVEDLIAYFEGTINDITVVDRVNNQPTSTLWKFCVSAKESDAESHFDGEPFEISDVMLTAFPAPQAILMSLEPVDSETVVDPAVLAAQAAASVNLLRVSFKAIMTVRPDGLFEAQSKADLGKLVLGESILKVKGVRYLCMPARAASSVKSSPVPVASTASVKETLIADPVEKPVSKVVTPAPSALPKPPVTTESAAAVMPPPAPPVKAPPAVSPSKPQMGTGIPVHAVPPGQMPPAKHAAPAPAQAGKPAVSSAVAAARQRALERAAAKTTPATAKDGLVLETEKTLQAKIAFMPDCAERSVLAALKYFKYTCADKLAAVVNPAAALELFETMKRQLIEENLSSTIVTSVLDALAAAVRNGSADECAKLCIQIRNDIAVLDTDFLVDLLKQNKEAARRIVGKDVILLLGNTGAGKSTTIHFLGGSEMQMVVDERSGRDHLKVVNTLAQLESFVTSSRSTSETIHINAIDLGNGITLCDTPGFEDNRGIEVDISNGLGIAEAVRGCRSVRPLYLFSFPSVGDRLDGVVEVLKNPVQMMAPVMERLPSFNYWFTKFDLNKYKDNNRIFLFATQKLESLLELETPDETMISIFEDMLRKIERRDCIAVNLDPLQDNRDQLLSELMSTPPIENPAEAFQNFASGDNLNKLKVQISKISSAIDNAIARRAYPIVAYRLSQLRTLADCLKLEECIKGYKDLVTRVQEVADHLQNASIDCFNTIGSVHDKTVENVLRKVVLYTCALYQMDEIRELHFPNITHYPSSCAQQWLLLQKQLASTVVDMRSAAEGNAAFLTDLKTPFDAVLINNQLDVMQMTVQALTEAFLQCGFDLAANADVSGLLTSLQGEYKAATDALVFMFDSLSASFAAALTERNVPVSLACLDKIKSFPSLAQHGSAKWSEDYKQFLVAFKEEVTLQNKKAMEQLSVKLLLDDSEERISTIQFAFKMAFDVSSNLTYMEDHYHPDDEIFSRFSGLKEVLNKSIETTKKKCADLGKPEAVEPFEKIKQRLTPFIKLRQMELIETNTIQSFTDLAETIRNLIAKAAGEVSTQIALLTGKNWNVQFKEFMERWLLLYGTLVLADLPMELCHGEYAAAELLLKQCLVQLRDDIAGSSTSLIQFHPSLTFVHALKKYFEENPSLNSPPSAAPEGPLASVTVTALLAEITSKFEERVTTVLVPFPAHFPTEGDLAEFKIDAESTLKVVRSLALAAAFQIGDYVAQMEQVKRFSAAHATAVGNKLATLFREIIDESTGTSEEVVSTKRDAANSVYLVIKYLKDTLSFYRLTGKRVLDNLSKQLNFNTTQMEELLLAVFHKELLPVFKLWTSPDTSDMFKYLDVLLQASEVPELPFEVLNAKWAVARALAQLDPLLKTILTGLKMQVANTYGTMERVFEERMRDINSDVSIDIKQQNYAKVHEFFESRNLSDPVQRTNFSPALKELNESINSHVFALKERAHKLVLTVHNSACINPLIEDLVKLFSAASEFMAPYLEEPLKSTLYNQVIQIQVMLLFEITRFYKTADGFINHLDFMMAEQVFMAVEQIIGSMFVDNAQYNAFHGAHTKDRERIDVDAKRLQIEAALTSITAKYDAAIEKVLAEATVAAPKEIVPDMKTAPSTGMDDEEMWDTYGSVTKSVASTVSSTFASVTKSVSKAVEKAMKPSNEQVPVDVLKQLLTAHPPKLYSEALLKASGVGRQLFYEGLEENLYSFLKERLLKLTACCEGSVLTRDAKEQLLGALSETSAFLSPKLMADIAVVVNELVAKINQDKINVQRELEEAKQTNDLHSFITRMMRYYSTYNFQDCYACKRHIASFVKSSVARMEEYVRTGDIAIVLKKLPKAFQEWVWHLDQCVAFYNDWQFRTAVFRMDRHHDLREPQTSEVVLRFVQNLSLAIKKLFNEAHSITKDDPRVFQLLASQFEVFELYHTEICKQTDAERFMYRLNRRLTAHWAPDELTTLLTKIVSTFKSYTSRLETLATATDLNPGELKICLEIYEKSEALHASISQFASTNLSPMYPQYNVLKGFSKQVPSFKVLKDSTVAEVFGKLASSVNASIYMQQKYMTPNAIDRDRAYAELYRSYQNLNKSAILKAFINPAVADLGSITRDCDKHITEELNKIKKHLIKDIEGSAELNPKDHKSLTIWLDNLRSFAHAFDGSSLSQHAATNLHEVNARFRAYLERMVNLASREKDNAKFLEYLFKLKQISVDVALLKKEVDGEIDVLLSKIKDISGSTRIVNIGVLLNQGGPNSSLAQMIVADHKAFEGNQLSVFNEKVSRFTLEDVLHDKHGIEGDSINYTSLREQYALFITAYQLTVTRGLPSEVNAKRCLECVAEAKRVANDPGIPLIDKVRQMMVQLFANWTLSNAEHFFDAAKVSEPQKGERDAMIEKEKDQRNYLLQPHAGQIIAIFRMMGLDTPSGNPANQFIQICTGEGKSVILAVVSCLFALLGYSVDCACYSEYLSRRDYNSFSKLFTAFGVYEHITYDTFTELSERYINATGDIRTAVQTILTTPKGSAWNKGPLQSNRGQKRKKVLLIDEVDVFFNKDFYGSAYRPLAKLADPTITELLDTVWKNRATTLNLAKVKAYKEYTAVTNKFPQWASLIEESVKTMVYDLKNFEPNDSKIVGDRIGYKDQDKISFDVFYGYKTIFAYYKANSAGKISAASLQAKKYLVIDCGSFSFAEIPKEYSFVLGVSGTLRTLSAPEMSLLRNTYKIQKFSYIPSVYGTNASSFAGDNGRDIKLEPQPAHFSAITREIDDRRTILGDTTGFKRPVLVFFESTKILLEYYNSSAASQLKPKIRMVTEEVSVVDKENIIRQATSPGSVTILSREFGRGTDFIIYDERVSQAGGVHVIQTFLSEELSEQVQIRGRSARQGCKGSYSMLLSYANLEKFGIKEFGPGGSVNEMKTTGRYEKNLNEKRRLFFEDKYKDTVQYVVQIAEDHRKAMDFRNALATVPIAGEHGSVSKQVETHIMSFLQDRNKSRVIEAPAFITRTLVLMDATGSMSAVLTKAKNTVKTMFTEALQVLEKNNITSAFEMQFAVYRNYNAPDPELLQYSGWEHDPTNLFQFMDTVQANYGLGNEAVEVGFWHANNELAAFKRDERLQVILIGDVPPNNEMEVSTRREDNNGGESYWSGTRFRLKTHYSRELARLKNAGVTVHAFYVHDCARTAFESIAREGGGECKELDINTGTGAETLTGLVTERIIDATAGGGAEGQRLIADYRQMFPKGYMRG